MLDLIVTMDGVKEWLFGIRLALWIALIGGLAGGNFLGWFQMQPVAITSPHPGDILQGMVNLEGVTDIPGFRTAEISFAYQNDPTQTWFLIQELSQPVAGGLLAAWDTTTITDGDYRLRLQVFLQDGQVVEAISEGVQVRNYTPVETVAPTVVPPAQGISTEIAPAVAAAPVIPASSQPTTIAQLTATPSPALTSIPEMISPVVLPTNPAQVTSGQWLGSAFKGFLAVGGMLVLSLIYFGSRAIFRR